MTCCSDDSLFSNLTQLLWMLKDLFFLLIAGPFIVLWPYTDKFSGITYLSHQDMLNYCKNSFLLLKYI